MAQKSSLEIDETGEDFSGIINALKKFLSEYYEPVADPRNAEIHFTTIEVWQQLLNVFPNATKLTPDIVAQWLHLGGFTFNDYGEMRLEWMFNRKQGE